MGWNGGSELMDQVIDALKKAKVPEEMRKDVYAKLIPAFEDHDCDVLDECTGKDKAYDQVYQQVAQRDDL